jgi:hypothetical protein
MLWQEPPTSSATDAIDWVDGRRIVTEPMEIRNVLEMKRPQLETGAPKRRGSMSVTEVGNNWEATGRYIQK